MRAYLFFLAIIGMVGLGACAEQEAAQGQAAAMPQPSGQLEAWPVRTAKANKGPFALRTLANGRIRAARRLEVRATASGHLLAFPHREGEAVAAGALLARFDDTRLQFDLQRQRLQLERAEYDKNDLIVLAGGVFGQDSSVSPQALANIRISSGLKLIEQDIAQTLHELSRCSLAAPFAGILADVKAQVGAQVAEGEVLCHLIDPGSYEVAFDLLEGEALRLRPATRVRVWAAGMADTLLAQVSSINPVVSAEGLVQVRAALAATASARRLFDGQNVQIAIEEMAPEVVVRVPRSAVVQREGRSVVFVYDAAEGRAKWKYVSVRYENDAFVGLSEGLEGGEDVIVDGHINLSHDAEVTRRAD